MNIVSLKSEASQSSGGRTKRVKITRDVGFSLRDVPNILGRVLRLALVYRRRLLFATGASLAASFLNLAMPRLLGWAVDQAHALIRSHPQDPAHGLHRLFLTGVLLLVVATLRGLLQMASGFQSEYIGQSVGRDLRLAFFEKLQRLGFDFHDRVHSGDLITRGMLDLEGVRGFIENGLQRFISLLLLVIVGLSMLFAQDPLMAVLTLSFVPVVGWRASTMGLALRRAWTKLQERMSVLTRVMEENLQGTRVVHAYAAKAFELEKFDKAGDDALALSNQRIFIRSRAMVSINSGYYLAMALVLWIGTHRVISGQISVGQLTEFLAFMTILQMPVRQIGMIMNSSARAVSSGKRLFEILDLAPTIVDKPNALALRIEKGLLRFEHVRFAYGTDVGAPLVLDDVSFSVAPGRTLGIVGPSGAGKSTLAQLIARFYDVSGGRITIDGQDIRDVTLESLRGAVGVVQQDVFLFDDSVQNNVSYADPDSEETRLVDAALTAKIHDHIATLPQGYNTKIGERGVSLSGGQRQRLSIARGLVPRPIIMVFDDATSAVDAATEHLVRQALHDATQESATIVISHRIGSLMHADEIIVLDRGKIVERGSHKDLLSAGGYYASLYLAQSQPTKTKLFSDQLEVRV